MLYDIPAHRFEKPVPVLKLLGDGVPHDFYLTGSRYMGGWRSDSDWDFLVQHSDAVLFFLEREGFSRCGDRKYDEPEGSRHSVWTVTRGGITIQVQVAFDVQIMRCVRDCIARLEYAEHKAVRGEVRTAIWGRYFVAIRDALRDGVDAWVFE